MSQMQYNTFLEMRGFFQHNLRVLESVIPMLIPIDEEDKQAFTLLMNMLTDINDRMQKATTLSDVADFIDLDALEEDWAYQKESIDRMTQCAKKIIEDSSDYWEDDTPIIQEAT